MTTTSTPVNRAQILTDFLNQVQNPIMSSGTHWHSTNMYNGHRLLGTPGQSSPSYPSNVGEITTTNIFYILHGFAVALTRHRLAQGWLQGDASVVTSLGYNLTSYAANNVIWFDYPAIPAVGTPMNAGTLSSFLSALRSSVESIKNSSNYASDMVVCHTSCHSSCHGSRGRR